MFPVHSAIKSAYKTLSVGASGQLSTQGLTQGELIHTLQGSTPQLHWEEVTEHGALPYSYLPASFILLKYPL